MTGQQCDNPLSVPLVPHSCFHCADVVLDFSTKESEGSISIHEFYDISPNIALDRGEEGCRFMSWAASTFFEHAKSQPHITSRQFGLRIACIRVPSIEATKGDIAGLHVMWADQDEDNLIVPIEISMSTFAYHGKQITPFGAIGQN
jgi:hypothetical protein